MTKIKRINWMSHFQEKSMSELVIPGTHDSFAYDMMITGPNENNMPKIINFIINFWSKTQNKTIEEQLKMGIRYFDIRATKYENEFYTIHSLISIHIDDVLNPIIEFVNNYPNEKIIIDFNHLYMDDKEEFREYVNNKLEGLMNKSNEDLFFIPISKVEKPLFVFMNLSKTEFNYRSHYITSYWHDTNKISQLVEDIKNEEDVDNLHVCQGILTPKQADIILGIILFLFFPSSLEALAENNKNKILTAIGESISQKNIVITDFVDEDLVDICITENITRKIKK